MYHVPGPRGISPGSILISSFIINRYVIVPNVLLKVLVSIRLLAGEYNTDNTEQAAQVLSLCASASGANLLARKQHIYFFGASVPTVYLFFVVIGRVLTRLH